MHPTPFALPRRTVRGLVVLLLLGSLLLLGPAQVSAEHDGTCHPEGDGSPFLIGTFVHRNQEISIVVPTVISSAQHGDRTETAHHPVRNITIDVENDTTSTVFQLSVSPGEARSC